MFEPEFQQTYKILSMQYLHNPSGIHSSLLQAAANISFKIKWFNHLGW